MKKQECGKNISKGIVEVFCGVLPFSIIEDFFSCNNGALPNSVFDNGVASILYSLLAEYKQLSILNVDSRAMITEYCRGLAARKIALENDLRIIGVEFTIVGICGVLSGGFGKIYNLYEDKSLRHSSDIDLLIAEDDIDKALEIFSEFGYEPFRKDGSCSVKKANVVIDIANKPSEMLTITSISEEASLFKELDWNWQSRIEDSSFSGFRQFDTETELVFQLLHFSYKHRGEKMIWALDLYLLFCQLEDTRIFISNAKNSVLRKNLCFAISQIIEIFDLAKDDKIYRIFSELKRGIFYPFYNYIYHKSFHSNHKDSGYLLAFFAGDLRVKIVMIKSLLRPPEYRIKTNTGNNNLLGYYLNIPIRILKAFR